MLVKIQRNQIHHFEQDGKDFLQLDINFVEHPSLPTYGIRVDVTGMDKAQVKVVLKAEILALIDRVTAQMQRDNTVRQHFDDWGWLEFETDNL